MFEDRADVAEADEDGGGGDEYNEVMALRKSVGAMTLISNEAYKNVICSEL